MPATIVQSSKAGFALGSGNVGLLNPPTPGNLLLMFWRIRGVADASSAGSWNSSAEYGVVGITVQASGSLWQVVNNIQISNLDGHAYINQGFAPGGDLYLPAFSLYWWKQHPIINNDENYAGWNPLVPGVGYGVFYKFATGAASDQALSVNTGFLSYDGDIFMLEITGNSASAPSVSGSTGTGTSATIDSETFPLFDSSLAWKAFFVQVAASDSSTLPIIFFPTAQFPPRVAAPPAGWSALTGGYSEIVTTATFAPLGSSGDVVTDICERAGLQLGQIDVSLLTNDYIRPNTTVKGYLIEQPRSAAEILKVLMQAYFFDGCETNGTMKWVPRGLAPALTIPEADLGLLADKAELEETLAQAQDLPQQITVIHDDPALDYQQNKQMKLRSAQIVGSTRQNIVLRIPMTMDADWARQVAEKALYLAWLERSTYKFNLWRSLYMMLDPTDVISFVYEGATFNARVSANTIGQGFVIEIECVRQSADSYSSSASGGSVQGYQTTPTTVVGPTQLWLFDIPLLIDTDSNPGGTGFYFGAGSAASDWAGMILEDSSDNSTFNPVVTDSQAVTFGYATTTLGSPATIWGWDKTNTLTVKLSKGSLSGDSTLNVLNGSNVLLIGTGAHLEVAAFKNATQNSDGTWTIDTLLRGLRGTEAACGTHGSNELVILVSSGLQRQDEALSVLGVPEYYKGVTVGQDATTAGSQELTLTGADLKPYAPCHIGGTVDGSGNITITWCRRTRIGGEADWADGVTDVPLSEDAELYDVEIMNGSTVVRTFSGVQTNSCVYTAAEQTSDFGSTQSQVTVHVYQRSAQVGRGYQGTGIAPTPGGWPLPFAAASSGGYGQFYFNGA